MYLTDMADVLRSWGLEVVEVPGWKTRGHGALTEPRSVINHHTAGPTAKRDPRDFPSQDTVVDGRPGLDGPLCNLGLGRSGTVYTVAAGKAWHSGVVFDNETYANEFAIGIEAENSGTGEPWPLMQMRAYKMVNAALCDHYGIPYYRVRGHKEICKPVGRKIDPYGINMSVMRAGVLREIELHYTPAHPLIPSKPPTMVLKRVLQFDERHHMTGNDVKEWQVVLLQRGYHLPEFGADGDFGKEVDTATRSFQRHKNLAADGRVGKYTIEAAGGAWAG